MAKNPRKVFEDINKVEGLNINDLACVSTSATGEEVKILKVADRKNWFFKVHPKGQIITDLIVNENKVMAIVKATVTDENDRILATGLGEGYYIQGNSITESYVSCAETKATGRALANAGFGNQFFDETDFDGNIPDSGVPVSKEEKPPLIPAGSLLDDAPKASDNKVKEFEKKVEALIKNITPAMSKGVMITYGPAQNKTLSDIYKTETNEDKLFTIKNYVNPSPDEFDDNHANVVAACRVFIKGIEEKKKQQEQQQ